MDRHKKGVELIRKGLACGRLHQLEHGVLYLSEGLTMVEETKDPRLMLSAAHNLALYLANLNLAVLARAVVNRAASLYRQYGDVVMKARLVWLQGTIERICGSYDDAIGFLEESRERFVKLGYDRQVAQIDDELKSAREKRDQVAA